jgi:hypothetical protein
MNTNPLPEEANSFDGRIKCFTRAVFHCNSFLKSLLKRLVTFFQEFIMRSFFSVFEFFSLPIKKLRVCFLMNKRMSFNEKLVVAK